MAETLKETLEETNAELETVEVVETEEKLQLQQIQVFQDVKKPRLLFGALMNKSRPKWLICSLMHPNNALHEKWPK